MQNRTKHRIVLVALAMAANGVLAQELKAEFTDPAWDGQKVPEAHNCNSATAMTPALKITGLPAESDYLTLSFRDVDGPAQMAADGGHGKLGYIVAAGSAELTLPSVQQGKRKNEMPEGVELLGEHKGKRAVNGYLAPCSQGQNHRYEVVIRAVTASDKNKALAETTLPIGRW